MLPCDEPANDVLENQTLDRVPAEMRNGDLNGSLVLRCLGALWLRPSEFYLFLFFRAAVLCYTDCMGDSYAGFCPELHAC